MPTATFAVLMSLGPAIAAIAGYLILNQALTLSEALAVGLVVAASIGAVRTATARRRPGRSGQNYHGHGGQAVAPGARIDPAPQCRPARRRTR